MTVAMVRSKKSARPRANAKVDTTAVVRVAAFKTALGWIAIAWRDDAVVRMAMGYESEPLALRALLDDEQLLAAHETVNASKIPWKLTARLKGYAAGKRDDFADVPVDLSHMTAFQQAVIRNCRRIGYGQASSYGELAEAAGKPRAARAVGTVMSSNRVPLIIPCHRVLAAGGKLGGYGGPRGTSLKAELLKLEGQMT